MLSFIAKKALSASSQPHARPGSAFLRDRTRIGLQPIIRVPVGLNQHSRYYAARSKPYSPKYETPSEKKAISPSRMLDPALERKMAPLPRKELAYSEDELGTAIFEAFDPDMEAREVDPESLNDMELEELVARQAAREKAQQQAKKAPLAETSRSGLAKSSKKDKTTSKAVPPERGVSKKSPQKSEIAELPAVAPMPSAAQADSSKEERKPLIAIVGRPNVGKSTLFNRLIRKSKSLITNTAGTTRDRKYGFAPWDDHELMFVDTGGMLGDDNSWAESITEQAKVAIAEADVIVLLTDFVEGPVDQDRLIARILRKTSKPVLLAVNKCDNDDRLNSESLLAFRQLGLGDPHPISASHGHGTAELLDALLVPIKKLGFPAIQKEDDVVPAFAVSEDKLVTSGAFNADGSRKTIRVAIVGVPNAGKSSLLNQILGKDRSVVSDRPGTTTDPIDEHIMWKDAYPITIVDTAGVRKKKSQEGHIEKLSALWSLKVIESSHVSVLMIDATTGPQAQDVRLSSYIIENYRSCIVVINKWDLAPERSLMGMQAYEEQLRERLQFWYYVPVVFASAKTGFNIDSIIAWIVRVNDERRIHLATRKLFQIIEQASIVKQPPASGRRRLKFRFCTQVNLGGSPTFVFFVNFPELVDGPYRRFLEGFIRNNFAFTGTPIRLMFRKNAGRTIAERDKRRNEKKRNEAKSSL